ncbi:PKD domain-containing protein [Pseudoalteromonas luteoviolacea]|uniref:PKD domain-containing protein n=1 Tax=Pseudoalteromonas luteoviolacea H33 TaxID=1365251 RepID=A0A167EQK2_9GAMM|nr:PKD domain-containing protein [Pseudoalteromonas luteoviolacea]KZN51080.1 hypothetical protein N476_14390 [Pseudoalteromonas luteoviolacea H33]KZN72127.1 hypothetical protein N477_03035 [Pseudoalteromonas luteoviolacea H33-S]
MKKLISTLLITLALPLEANQLDYFWDFGDGTVSHLAEPEHQYDAVGIYLVKRQVYQNGVLIKESEKEVDLVTPKIVELDITLPELITEEEQTQITAQLITSEPLEAIRYQWYLDEQPLSDALSEPVLDHVFSEAGTYVLALNLLWEQATVKSLKVDILVEEQTDPGDGDTDPGDGDTDPGDGDADPGDGNTDPGDGDTDPDGGDKAPSDGDKVPDDEGGDDGDTPDSNKSPDSGSTDDTASNRVEQSSGGGSLGIVSLLGLLCFALRRRK